MNNELFEEHTQLLAWMTGVSVTLFIACMIITSYFIATIPDDYFKQEKRPKVSFPAQLIPRIIGKIIKNLIGILLLISGIFMLVLPGQGLLTLLIGLLLIDYPGKYLLEKKLLSYPLVLNSINWIRRKHNKRAFTKPFSD